MNELRFRERPDESDWELRLNMKIPIKFVLFCRHYLCVVSVVELGNIRKRFLLHQDY